VISSVFQAGAKIMLKNELQKDLCLKYAMVTTASHLYCGPTILHRSYLFSLIIK
jgi:hypothetical protein